MIWNRCRCHFAVALYGLFMIKYCQKFAYSVERSSHAAILWSRRYSFGFEFVVEEKSFFLCYVPWATSCREVHANRENGRRSLDVVVPELPLAECVKFWGKSATRIDRREIVDVLSVTGGIPRYLEEINPGASANENIRRLAFRPKGVLREDFDEMFSDVITSLPTLTEAVLRTLLNHT